MSAWLWPLLATILMQTSVSFLLRLVPTLAPVLTAQAGVTPAFVGHLSAVGTIGSMVFLLAGIPLIRRTGPIRALQVGALLAAAGVALIAVPFWPAIALGSFLIGVGYGPTAPAGSDLVQRFAPKQHRTLIFSVKQAGVPLGGVLAGLMLPPLAAVDWRVAIGVSAAIGLASILLVQPLRERMDTARDRTQALSLSTVLSPTNLLVPLTAMRLSPVLPPLTYVAFCFAVTQGAVVAFFVTYLAVDLGTGLAAAGAAFAVMQATGIFGRVLLGWVADRLGSAVHTLRVLGIASAATMTVIALTTPGWPLWALVALAGLAGITVSSWNGIYLAEVARIVPLPRVGEATAGSTLLTFVGYVVGPSGFALILEATASYRTAFLTTAALSLTATAALWRLASHETSRPTLRPEP